MLGFGIQQYSINVHFKPLYIYSIVLFFTWILPLIFNFYLAIRITLLLGRLENKKRLMLSKSKSNQMSIRRESNNKNNNQNETKKHKTLVNNFIKEPASKLQKIFTRCNKSLRHNYVLIMMSFLFQWSLPCIMHIVVQCQSEKSKKTNRLKLEMDW